MQPAPTKKLYTIKVEMANGDVREVNVKAASQAVAESRALKRTFGAVRIHRA